MFEERKNLLNNTAQEASAGLKQWYGQTRPRMVRSRR
jgi:hypothetical protein